VGVGGGGGELDVGMEISSCCQSLNGPNHHKMHHLGTPLPISIPYWPYAFPQAASSAEKQLF